MLTATVIPSFNLSIFFLRQGKCFGEDICAVDWSGHGWRRLLASVAWVRFPDSASVIHGLRWQLTPRFDDLSGQSQFFKVNPF